jgi:hypothetical protein
VGEFLFLDSYPEDNEGEEVFVPSPAKSIMDHRYDNGPVNEHGPCIYGEDTFRPFGGSATCGRPEEEHALSEYVQQPPGDMHEPKPYTGELDWDNDRLLHPFID